jgi:hypothetical protein
MYNSINNTINKNYKYNKNKKYLDTNMQISNDSFQFEKYKN